MRRVGDGWGCVSWRVRRCGCGGCRCSGRYGLVGPVRRGSGGLAAVGRGGPVGGSFGHHTLALKCPPTSEGVRGRHNGRLRGRFGRRLAAVGRYKSHGLGRLLLCLRVRSGAKPAILGAIHPFVSARPAHQASGSGLTRQARISALGIQRLQSLERVKPGSGGGHTWRRVQAPKSPQRRARTWPCPGGGLDLAYVCDNCGAEITARSGEPGSDACPVCEHPRRRPPAVDELVAALAAHRRSLSRGAKA